MSDRTADTCEGVSVKARTKPVTLFSCSREKVYCSTGCGRRAVRGCAFELRGKLEGKTCDAPLCDRCLSAHGCCPTREGQVKTFSKEWTDEERLKIVLLLAGQIQSDIPAGLYGAVLEEDERGLPTKFRPNMQSIQNVIVAPRSVMEEHREDFEALVTDAMGVIGRERDEFFEPLDREKFWEEGP